MMVTLDILLISRDHLLKGIDQAICDYNVAALTKDIEGRIKFDTIQKSADIEFKYVPTILSPKKFFFPQDEVILEYTSEGKVTPKIEAKPMVLFGVRPCDLNGIKILNEAFADANGDPNYLAKKEQTVVIGMDCKKICDENAFCYKVKSNEAKAGFDIMLYEGHDQFAIKVATEKGEKFVQQYLKTEKNGQPVLEQFKKEKADTFAKEVSFDKLDTLPEVFEKNKSHPVWKQEGEKCLSCGSCIMVCPTCYCFDVADEWKLNLKEGQRLRRWDACMLQDFATVAGGENFRKAATERLHHRINRKFDYLMRKHGQPVCVGCGRCVRACLAKISPKKIVESIVGE